MARVSLTVDSECNQCRGEGWRLTRTGREILCRCVSPAPAPPSTEMRWCPACEQNVEAKPDGTCPNTKICGGTYPARACLSCKSPTPTPPPDPGPSRTTSTGPSSDPIELWARLPTKVAMFTSDPATRAEIVAVVRAAAALSRADTGRDVDINEEIYALHDALDALRAKLREQMEG